MPDEGFLHIIWVFGGEILLLLTDFKKRKVSKTPLSMCKYLAFSR